MSFPYCDFLPSMTFGLHSIAGDAYPVDAPGLGPSGVHAIQSFSFS